MPRLIFERALRRNPLTGDVVSYWPQRWPLELLAKELQTSGSAFFAASYQNDPSALEGNALKTDWLTFYDQTELVAARQAANTNCGPIYAGIDPAVGGVGVDADYCAMVSGELLGRHLYLTDCYLKRLPIETQAQTIEDWLDLWSPSFTTVEDTSSKGYVYTALSTQINEGKGSKHTFQIEKPQGGNAQGNKLTRFLSMAARFENAQVRVPGQRTATGWVVDHRFEQWLEQWRSFPSGHDDALDGTYWCVFTAFKTPIGASVTMDAVGAIEGGTLSAEETESVVAIRQERGYPVDMRGKELPPIGTPYRRRGSLRLTRPDFDDPWS